MPAEGRDGDFIMSSESGMDGKFIKGAKKVLEGVIFRPDDEVGGKEQLENVLQSPIFPRFVRVGLRFVC